MAVAGVSVCIEAVHEHQIQEVSLDGQETLIPYSLLYSPNIILAYCHVIFTFVCDFIVFFCKTILRI